ncbi:MAG: site-specific integrase, partial [Candidatus Peribacteraceae bacterium]|nr:site-specific integrase [Candidatus Peribacteraceae bacterium]
KYLKEAGIIRKFRNHDLRHTYAMEYLMKGGDVRDLQKDLGHTSLDVTMRYIELLDDDARMERGRNIITSKPPVNGVIATPEEIKQY